MLRTTRRLALSLALPLALAPGAALAHTGVGDVHGLAHGFAHPLGGLDHVLAMVAVGLLAAQRGGRALWLVPLAFVGMMVAGGALGAAGVGLPSVEAGIALSVVVIGAAVALRLDLPTGLAMALVGVFAVFHGHAHGAEMPETASALAYGTGFVGATLLLHALGLGLGLTLGRLGTPLGHRLAQGAGGAMALTGIALLANTL